MGMGEQNETTDGCRSLLLQAFYDAAFVSIFSAVRPSVHARFAPFTVAWGASESERELSEKYENMQIMPRAALAPPLLTYLKEMIADVAE